MRTAKAFESGEARPDAAGDAGSIEPLLCETPRRELLRDETADRRISRRECGRYRRGLILMSLVNDLLEDFYKRRVAPDTNAKQ